MLRDFLTNIKKALCIFMIDGGENVFFSAYTGDINATNMSTMFVMSIGLVFVGILCFIVSFFFKFIRPVRFVYVIIIIFNAALSVAVYLISKRRAGSITALCYIFYFSALLTCAFMSLYVSADVPSVLLCSMFFVLPMLFILPNLPTNIFFTVMLAAYMVVAYFMKDYAAFMYDIVDDCVALLCGLMIKRIFMTTRIKLIVTNRRMSDMIMTDTLTGLHNRMHFNSYIESAYRECCTLSVAMTDIDDYKKYNDTYGHINGDACLKKIADKMRSLADFYGIYVARISGEEFVFIARGICKDGFSEMMKTVVTGIYDVNIVSENAVYGRITISSGVAEKNEDKCADSVDLLRYADEALYAAKNSGKNRVVKFARSEIADGVKTKLSSVL